MGLVLTLIIICDVIQNYSLPITAYVIAIF